MIYFGSDHGGFKLKNHLIEFLMKHGRIIEDLGAYKLEKTDDYPEVSAQLAKKVASNSNNLGVLICRSGQGVCIVANKFKNVRASLVWNTKEAKMSRLDDMANVLCLPADYVTPKEAEKILVTWLATPYSKAERHKRRVAKVNKLGSK